MGKSVHSKLATLGVSISLMGTGMAAHRSLAQNNVVEIAVQGRSADGGDQFQIVGNSQRVRFSLTGRVGDIAGVTPHGYSSPLFESSIQDIIDGRSGPLRVEGVERLTDGRTRIFVRVDNPIRSLFHGSQVRLRTGNYLFDSDHVTIR